jgi:ABC-type multidrug transport system fused ATPase/permease subunit
MKRHWFGYAAIALIIFGTLLTWFNRKRLKAVLTNARDKLKALEMKSLTQSQLQQQEYTIYREQIERVKPKLGVLRARLEDQDDNVDIDYLLTPGKIFEDLDTSKDGVLSYQEINAMLQLDDDQLRMFVNSMNDLGGLPPSTKTVDRDVFQKYFLDVLERAAFIKATPQDAENLWLEAAETHKLKPGEKLPYNYFYDSSLSNFLSDSQIFFLIRHLKRQMDLSPLETGETADKSISVRDLSDRDTNVFSLRSERSRNIGGISLEDFKLHYPSALHKVAGKKSQDLTVNTMSDGPVSVGLDIAFKNLSLTVKKGEKEMKVVNSCTGRLRSNTMTAILGGSGAGKTSLLNALCGRAPYGIVSGETRINGKIATIDEHRKSIGFVPQDDIVYAEL